MRLNGGTRQGRASGRVVWGLALAATGVLAGGVALLWSAPPWLVRAIATARPGCVFLVQTPAAVVALTIDDGPDAQTTPPILDVLGQYGARATFFLVSSRVAGNEAIIAALVRGGHEVGNHFTRDQPSIRLVPDRFEASLLEADSVLGRFAPVRWARPGSGWYTARMVAIMRRHGYRCALGSVYPYDARLPWARFAARFVLRQVHPGAIIVLHDGGARGMRTAAVLAEVLPALQRRGYRVVTLSTLVEVAGR